MGIQSETKYLTIFDYIKIVLKYKRAILISTVLMGAITAFIMFFILDPIFMSKATVKSTQKSSGLSGILSGTMAGLSDLSELGSGGGSYKELALYENILNSRRCIDDVLIKFKLNDDWEFKYFQDAVKNFRENIMVISKDKVAATMEIGIYDKDPKRAKEIVEYLIVLLNKINAELNVQNAKNNREFVEARYYEIKDNLKKTEDSLKSYQELYGLAPDIQAATVSQSLFNIEVQIKSEEIKLELLNKVLTQDQPEVKMQEQKIAALKQQLSEIKTNDTADPDDLFKLKGAPQKVLNFLRLKRDVEIQNKLLAFILPMFEQAKIEEKKETPTVIILDNADLPEKKSKPKRLTITFIAMLVMFLASSSISVLYDKKDALLLKIKN
ncbi:MAG: Wzz/FepE/Etk N-terminal domain-containing protein [Ignavibacteriae bacterium]|nr:Wzz/FepE/Etk N-terminal domain-containing protein [Ignavibacteriota bacterium]